MGCFCSKYTDTAAAGSAGLSGPERRAFAPQILPNGAVIRVSSSALPGSVQLHMNGSYAFGALLEGRDRFAEAAALCRQTAHEVAPLPPQPHICQAFR